jgi:hypothetical protein
MCTTLRIVDNIYVASGAILLTAVWLFTLAIAIYYTVRPEDIKVPHTGKLEVEFDEQAFPVHKLREEKE